MGVPKQVSIPPDQLALAIQYAVAIAKADYEARRKEKRSTMPERIRQQFKTG